MFNVGLGLGLVLLHAVIQLITGLAEIVLTEFSPLINCSLVSGLPRRKPRAAIATHKMIHFHGMASTVVYMYVHTNKVIKKWGTPCAN